MIADNNGGHQQPPVRKASTSLLGIHGKREDFGTLRINTLSVLDVVAAEYPNDTLLMQVKV